jgi:hypothetical protein
MQGKERAFYPVSGNMSGKLFWACCDLSIYPFFCIFPFSQAEHKLKIKEKNQFRSFFILLGLSVEENRFMSPK